MVRIYDKIKYTLKEVAPSIWLVECDDSFDLAMLFCRYQEFYESPFTGIKGKVFNMFDYIRFYSRKNKNKFTYAEDWRGFNIPSDVIYEILSYDSDTICLNIYDHEMFNIAKKINGISLKPFYLIGVKKGDTATIKHEMAHGFYSTNKDYHDAMIKLLKSIPLTLRKKAFICFKKMGYNKAVHMDELHAYLIDSLMIKI